MMIDLGREEEESLVQHSYLPNASLEFPQNHPLETKLMRCHPRGHPILNEVSLSSGSELFGQIGGSMLFAGSD